MLVNEEYGRSDWNNGNRSWYDQESYPWNNESLNRTEISKICLWRNIYFWGWIIKCVEKSVKGWVCCSSGRIGEAEKVTRSESERNFRKIKEVRKRNGRKKKTTKTNWKTIRRCSKRKGKEISRRWEASLK